MIKIISAKMSQSNIFLTSRQLAVIAVAASILAWFLSASGSFSLIGYVVWLVILFTFFSMVVFVISLMVRGASKNTAGSRRSKNRNLYIDQTDRINHAMYEFEQDGQDDKCDSDSSANDSSGGSFDSSSD